MLGLAPDDQPASMRLADTSVIKFFNRLLALDVQSQELMFQFFENIFHQVVEDQYAAGTVSGLSLHAAPIK